MIAEKIEIDVTGKVFGFREDGEDIDTARARILLEAEMRGNEGKSRIHLSIKSSAPTHRPDNHFTTVP